MPKFGAWPSTWLRMFGVLGLLAVLAWPHPGAAEGALAIGTRGDHDRRNIPHNPPTLRSPPTEVPECPLSL